MTPRPIGDVYRVLNASDIPTTDPCKLAAAIERYCQIEVGCVSQKSCYGSVGFMARVFAAGLAGVATWAGQEIENGTYASGGFTTSSGMAVAAEEALRAAVLAMLNAGAKIEVEP